MSTGQELKNSHSLGYKLKQTQHLLRLHMDEALRPLNITTPQYAVLSQLEVQPGISNAALARASFITAQTMHAIIKNLEKNKLVTRVDDEKHGRIICTRLTKQGVDHVQKAHKLVDKAESKMTHTLTNQNVTVLNKLLTECFDNLSKAEYL